MFRRSRLALALLGLALLPPAAGALPITIVEVERSAQASASAAGGGTTALDSVDLSDAATGALVWRSDPAVAAIPFAAGTAASPFYVGVVGASEISAAASAEVNAHAQQSGAFTFGSAEVVQRIVFEATSAALLRLEVDLLALARSGVAGDSFALIEIRSLGGVLDPNPLLIRRTAEPGEQASYDLDFAVESGASYQILALARAAADAIDFEDANDFRAGFFLAVTEVPEPGTAALLLAGALALGVRRARG